MKILFTYYRYSPHSNGPSNYIDNVSEQLKELGYHVDLISHNEQWTHLQLGSRKIDKLQIKRHLIKEYRSLYEDRYPLWIFWREMERYSWEKALAQLDLHEYNLIHCHDFITARAISRVTSPSIPIIVSLHNCKYHESLIIREYETRSLQEQQYIQWEECLGAMSGNVLLVPCEWLRNQLVGMGANPSVIRNIPYGIRKEPFLTEDRDQLSSEYGNKLIIFCPARLVPIKGHKHLFEALYLLSRERDDFICLIAGEGIQLDPLKNTVEELGLQGQIRFLGKRRDVPQLMKISDVVVLPSLHETFPLVLLEAQLCEKPVLSTNVGGIPEIVNDGHNGLLVPPGNSQALADKLRLLLDDCTLRQRISEQAKKTAWKHWLIERHIESLVQVYQHSISSDSQRSTTNNFGTWQPDWEILNRISSEYTPKPAFTYTLKTSITPELTIEPKADYVHLLDMSGVALQTEEIGKDGRFTFQHIPPGSYVLKSTRKEIDKKVITVGNICCT